MNVNEITDLMRRYPQPDLRQVFQIARQSLYERVKIGECWRVYDADGDLHDEYDSSDKAWIVVDALGMCDGARVVHVTRYRRKA